MAKHLITPSSPRSLFDPVDPPSRARKLKNFFNDPLVKAGGAFVGCLIGITALIHVTVSDSAPAPQNDNAHTVITPSP